jgi:hypothetical protein
MNSSSPLSGQIDVADASTMSRREAIKRAALLLGVAFSPSLVDSALQAQTAAGGGAGAQPAYLSAKQFEAVSAIADRILPRTDTPGALDVGVPAFVDLMYGRYVRAADQAVVAAGLADLETASGAAHRRGFGQLTPAQQDALLTTVAEASGAKERTFFHQIKELVVIGYFSSERIGKTVLHYDPVPGRFDGCIPIAEVGNVAWTK